MEATHTPKIEGGTFSGARGIWGLLGILKVQGSLSAKHFPKFMLLYILKPIKDILEVLQGCFAERPGREIPNQAFAQGLIGIFFFVFLWVCVCYGLGVRHYNMRGSQNHWPLSVIVYFTARNT